MDWKPGFIATLALVLVACTTPQLSERQVQLRAYAQWISENSDLPLPKVYPTLERMAENGLCIAVWGHECNLEGAIIIEGMYDPSTATIYLNTNIDLDSLYGRSLLLYEMVHHMQTQAGRVYACPGNSEPQAYSAQATWLAEQGVEDPWAAMHIDSFTVMIISQC